MYKTVLGLSAALALALLAVACITVRRANRSIQSARAEISRAGSMAFTLAPVASASGVRFDPVTTDETPTSVAVFAGKLYLAGPFGLSIYTSPQAPHRSLRVGIDLPPAPILGLTVAHLRGQPNPALVGVTRGAGLLLLDSAGPSRLLQPSSADARDITAVLPLASGELLIGTRRAGLLVFDGAELRSFSPLLAKVDVTALAGNDADFWIGTRQQGLLHWHGGQLDTLQNNAGLPDNTILSLADSPRGLFVGTPLGVAQVTDGHVVRQVGRGLFAQSLAVQSDTLLVSTLDQGLQTIALNHLAEPVAFVDASGPKVTRLIVSGDQVFGLSQGSLLSRDRSGIWQTLLATPARTTADRDVSALSFSPDGRLWIGYFDRGLDVLDLSTMRAQHLEDDHLFCVNRIIRDPGRKTMDIATANGLVLLDSSAASPAVRQVLTRRDGLAADQITDVAFSVNGTMVATPAGITVLTPSGAQSMSSFQGLANNHVYALAADPANPMAIAGTLAGISIINQLSVASSVSLRNSSLPRNWITAVAKLNAPGVPPSWFVGTYGGSLVEMDANGRVTRLDTPVPNAIVNPNALLVTPEHVFAGTLSNGLLAYNRSTKHWTQIESGLPSLNVTAFAVDSGELYVGTSNGIVRLAEQALP